MSVLGKSGLGGLGSYSAVSLDACGYVCICVQGRNRDSFFFFSALAIAPSRLQIILSGVESHLEAGPFWRLAFAPRTLTSEQI